MASCLQIQLSILTDDTVGVRAEGKHKVICGTEKPESVRGL